MAHAQKPHFVFRRNGRVNLNRRGASVKSTTSSRDVRMSGSNAGYTTFRGSVKSTGYPPNSPVSPFTSLPVRHRVSSHFNWSLPKFWKYSVFICRARVSWQRKCSRYTGKWRETAICTQCKIPQKRINISNVTP